MNINQIASKFLLETLVEKLAQILLGEKIPFDIIRPSNGKIMIPANRKITKTLLREVAAAMILGDWETDPSPIRNKLIEYFIFWENEYQKAALGYVTLARQAIAEEVEKRRQ